MMAMRSLLVLLVCLGCVWANSDPLFILFDGRACDLTLTTPFSERLIAQMECDARGAVQGLSQLSEGVAFEAAHPTLLPYLEPAAAASLATVAAAGSPTLGPLPLKTAYRSLPLEFVLQVWAENGACAEERSALLNTTSIQTSVFGTGLAVEVSNGAAWQAFFTGNGWSSFAGIDDSLVFTFADVDAVSDNTFDRRVLGVMAFQNMWNFWHDMSRVFPDGLFTLETQQRLAQAPRSGLPTTCSRDRHTTDDQVALLAIVVLAMAGVVLLFGLALGLMSLRTDAPQRSERAPSSDLPPAPAPVGTYAPRERPAQWKSGTVRHRGAEAGDAFTDDDDDVIMAKPAGVSSSGDGGPVGSADVFNYRSESSTAGRSAAADHIRRTLTEDEELHSSEDEDEWEYTWESTEEGYTYETEESR